MMYRENEYENDSDQEEDEKCEHNIDNETHTVVVEKTLSKCFGDLDNYADATAKDRQATHLG